jgi:plastocyanin
MKALAWKWIVLCAFVGCAVTAARCSRSETPPPAAAAPPAPAATSPSAGRVAGKVPAPPAGIPVIIVLDPKAPREFPPQTDRPVMDQVALTFGPALLFVRTSQPAEFRNSDDTLHNVHVTHEETREPQFNVAIPTGENYTYTFKRDGFYHVGCDIHPAMAAEIFASASPYVTMAEGDGSFALEDVLPGAYALTVFASGTRTGRDITVVDGAATNVNLTVE